MERDEMMEMPVRSLSMRERIEDLCTVDLRKIETCGQRPGVEELPDGRRRAYVYTDPVKSFDVYVAGQLCGEDFNQAIVYDRDTRKKISERFKSVGYTTLEPGRLMLPVSGDLMNALSYLAQDQGFPLPEMTPSKHSWVMFAADSRQRPSDEPRRQLNLLRLENISASDKQKGKRLMQLIIDLTPTGPYLRFPSEPSQFVADDIEAA